MEALQRHVAMRGLYMLLMMGYCSCRVSSAAARGTGIEGLQGQSVTEKWELRKRWAMPMST